MHTALQVFEAAEEALKTEEQVKERLCQELNLLVQQSAHAQLEKLEQVRGPQDLMLAFTFEPGLCVQHSIHRVSAQYCMCSDTFGGVVIADSAFGANE